MKGDGMATVRKEIVVDVEIEEVWDAVRDFRALHERLVPGFAVDTRLEGEDRIVTFFDGSVYRERLISVSDGDRRLAWTIVDGPWTHHSGSVELHAEDRNRTRFVWTTDMLPHETAEATEQMMEKGMKIIHATLEAKTRAGGGNERDRVAERDRLPGAFSRNARSAR
jgi:hypothetical protein